MKTLFLLFLPLSGWATEIYTCHYDHLGAPGTRFDFTTVELQVGPDGVPLSPATILVQGQSHQESVSPVNPAPNERVHLWLSKELPERDIEMVIYRERTARGQSVLTNHHVPFAKDMWGDCSVTVGKAPR